MPGCVHVEAVRTAIRAVIARTSRDKDCAVSPGDSIPHRIPTRVEEAAHHTPDLPCVEASQDGLDVGDDRSRRAAPQPIIVPALYDCDLGPRSCCYVKAAEHSVGRVAADP